MQARDPDFEAGLIRRLLANPTDLALLSPEERQYLLGTKLQAPCPVCQKPFSIYDGANTRIRLYCSRLCRNRSRATRRLAWDCVICHTRHPSSNGLHRHIRVVHPECDKHEYMRRYYVAKVWDL